MIEVFWLIFCPMAAAWMLLVVRPALNAGIEARHEYLREAWRVEERRRAAWAQAQEAIEEARRMVFNPPRDVDAEDVTR